MVTTGEDESDDGEDGDLDRRLKWVKGAQALDAPGRVSVLSYNVLARCHAEAMHARSRPADLTWSFRRRRLLEEIKGYACDLVCLQDVDDYEGFWLPGLNALGYDTIYAPRAKGPRPRGRISRRGYAVGTSRDAAAAATGICRGDGVATPPRRGNAVGSRRHRGRELDMPWGRDAGAAATRIVRGDGVATPWPRR